MALFQIIHWVLYVGAPKLNTILLFLNCRINNALSFPEKFLVSHWIVLLRKAENNMFETHEKISFMVWSTPTSDETGCQIQVMNFSPLDLYKSKLLPQRSIKRLQGKVELRGTSVCSVLKNSIRQLCVFGFSHFRVQCLEANEIFDNGFKRFSGPVISTDKSKSVMKFRFASVYIIMHILFHLLW